MKDGSGGPLSNCRPPPAAPEALPGPVYPALLPTLGADLQFRPAPSLDGSLFQDPDFALPTPAGPLEWRLAYDSQAAAETGPYGFGRRGAFPLRLDSDGTTCTVTHEDGTRRQYRKDALNDLIYPAGDNYDQLVQNADGSWDETLWESGYRYHYPAGTAVRCEYRQSPHGGRLTYE